MGKLRGAWGGSHLDRMASRQIRAFKDEFDDIPGGDQVSRQYCPATAFRVAATRATLS